MKIINDIILVCVVNVIYQVMYKYTGLHILWIFWLCYKTKLYQNITLPFVIKFWINRITKNNKFIKALYKRLGRINSWYESLSNSES